MSAKWKALQKKKNGMKICRKTKLTGNQIADMRSKRFNGVLIKDLMVQYSLSKASVYRLLKQGNNYNKLLI